MAEYEFVPGSRPAGPDCTDRAAYGTASNLDQYIAKQYLIAEEDYPKDACPNRFYSTAKIDNWEVTTAQTGAGSINMEGSITSATEVTANGITLTSRKPFDIPHPTKDGYRLRHVCLEGPESGVYIRGKLKGTSITVPAYWGGLVDEESISVHLTPIGCHQELFVESIQYGRRIQVRNALGGPIECYYLIQAERKDVEKLIPEYEGNSIDDYPGDNSKFSINR